MSDWHTAYVEYFPCVGDAVKALGDTLYLQRAYATAKARLEAEVFYGGAKQTSPLEIELVQIFPLSRTRWHAEIRYTCDIKGGTDYV